MSSVNASYKLRSNFLSRATFSSSAFEAGFADRETFCFVIANSFIAGKKSSSGRGRLGGVAGTGISRHPDKREQSSSRLHHTLTPPGHTALYIGPCPGVCDGPGLSGYRDGFVRVCPGDGGLANRPSKNFICRLLRSRVRKRGRSACYPR